MDLRHVWNLHNPDIKALKWKGEYDFSPWEAKVNKIFRPKNHTAPPLHFCDNAPPLRFVRNKLSQAVHLSNSKQYIFMLWNIEKIVHVWKFEKSCRVFRIRHVLPPPLGKKLTIFSRTFFSRTPQNLLLTTLQLTALGFLPICIRIISSSWQVWTSFITIRDSSKRKKNA